MSSKSSDVSSDDSDLGDNDLRNGATRRKSSTSEIKSTRSSKTSSSVGNSFAFCDSPFPTNNDEESPIRKAISEIKFEDSYINKTTDKELNEKKNSRNNSNNNNNNSTKSFTSRPDTASLMDKYGTSLDMSPNAIFNISDHMMAMLESEAPSMKSINDDIEFRQLPMVETINLSYDLEYLAAQEKEINKNKSKNKSKSRNVLEQKELPPLLQGNRIQRQFLSHKTTANRTVSLSNSNINNINYSNRAKQQNYSTKQFELPLSNTFYNSQNDNNNNNISNNNTKEDKTNIPRNEITADHINNSSNDNNTNNINNNGNNNGNTTSNHNEIRFVRGAGIVGKVFRRDSHNNNTNINNTNSSSNNNNTNTNANIPRSAAVSHTTVTLNKEINQLNQVESSLASSSPLLLFGSLSKALKPYKPTAVQHQYTDIVADIEGNGDGELGLEGGDSSRVILTENFKVHKRISGWKLTTPARRRELIRILDKFNRGPVGEDSSTGFEYPDEETLLRREMRETVAWEQTMRRYALAHKRRTGAFTVPSTINDMTTITNNHNSNNIISSNSRNNIICSYHNNKNVTRSSSSGNTPTNSNINTVNTDKTNWGIKITPSPSPSSLLCAADRTSILQAGRRAERMFGPPLLSPYDINSNNYNYAYSHTDYEYDSPDGHNGSDPNGYGSHPNGYASHLSHGVVGNGNGSINNNNNSYNNNHPNGPSPSPNSHKIPLQLPGVGEPFLLQLLATTTTTTTTGVEARNNRNRNGHRHVDTEETVTDFRRNKNRDIRREDFTIVKAAAVDVNKNNNGSSSSGGGGGRAKINTR